MSTLPPAGLHARQKSTPLSQASRLWWNATPAQCEMKQLIAWKKCAAGTPAELGNTTQQQAGRQRYYPVQSPACCPQHITRLRWLPCLQGNALPAPSSQHQTPQPPQQWPHPQPPPPTVTAAGRGPALASNSSSTSSSSRRSRRNSNSRWSTRQACRSPLCLRLPCCSHLDPAAQLRLAPLQICCPAACGVLDWVCTGSDWPAGLVRARQAFEITSAFTPRAGRQLSIPLASLQPTSSLQPAGC